MAHVDPLEAQLTSLDRLARRVAADLHIRVEEAMNVPYMRRMVMEYLRMPQNWWLIPGYFRAATAYPSGIVAPPESTRLDIWRRRVAHAVAQRIAVLYGPLYGFQPDSDYMGPIQLTDSRFIHVNRVHSNWADLWYNWHSRQFLIVLLGVEAQPVPDELLQVLTVAALRFAEKYHEQMVYRVELQRDLPEQRLPGQWAALGTDDLYAGNYRETVPGLPQRKSRLVPMGEVEYMVRIGLRVLGEVFEPDPSS